MASAIEGQIQVSHDGATVWVHSMDGSTVGRFSKSFGLDVHTTARAQLAGADQCLNCTHEPAGKAEWALFCRLMREHHQIDVPIDLVEFEDREASKTLKRDRPCGF